MSGTISGDERGTAFALLAALLMALCTAINATSAYADCGYEDRKLDSAKDFADSYSGNLALKFDSNFFVLRRDHCTKFGSINTHLRIYLNHLGLTQLPERAFLSVHVAFLNPRDLRSIIYLYRNSANGNHDWTEDENRARDYQSLHPYSHPEFNDDLKLSRQEFDAKYRSGKRTWNDKISSDNNVYETWDTRSNFEVRNDFISAAINGRGGVRVQNYFINFTTGDRDKDDPLKNAPNITADAAGSKCIFIRVSGSPNISGNVTGEYIVALNGTETCESTISHLLGIGFFQWLFGVRN